MKATIKALIVMWISALAAGCSVISPIPSCPTDDPYQYLLCVQPTFSWLSGLTEEQVDEALQKEVEFVDLYCTDSATEWLPALDAGVKKAYPQIREYLRSEGGVPSWFSEMYALEGHEFESLKGRNLHRAVVTMFLRDFASMGAGNYRKIYGSQPKCHSPNPMSCQYLMVGNCTYDFQRLGDGDLVEAIKQHKALEQ